MSNTIPRRDNRTNDISGIEVYTKILYDLNVEVQEAVREFALHDVDDEDGLEIKRLAMHDAMTKMYDQIADFSENIMTEEFDIAYLRERIASAEGDLKAQLQSTHDNLVQQAQRNTADVWMARVMAWLHQAAAASGPFVIHEHDDKKQSASRLLSAVYTMLERPFSAVASKTDGTQKLRRVALGHMAYQLIQESSDTSEAELNEIKGKTSVARAEFHDEFLNELINSESTFRQAFNPFDEIVWKDILSSFIFEQATDLYNEAIMSFKNSSKVSKQHIERIESWKANTAGLSEVYLAMTYNDIADAQMRAGNLEDASKLYQAASDAFHRAEKAFGRVISLRGNSQQSMMDKEHKKAQSLFCRAEASVQVLSDLLEVDNKSEAVKVLQEIFKDLHKAEKLSRTRSLTAAVKENLRIFSFVERQLEKDADSISGIIDQIELAKGIRKESLIQDINKSLDMVQRQLGSNPNDALESIRDALTSLGILLSLESTDSEVNDLRNRTLALLNNVKYVIQFQLSSQIRYGISFIKSRILENLHAREAASYYELTGDKKTANDLVDLGRLALGTAYASEAQVLARQSEQWAFRAQIERTGALSRLGDELAEFSDEEVLESTMKAHDVTIGRINHVIASFTNSSRELSSVASSEIRQKNNIETQIKQIEAVILKFKGDLSRLQGAKSDFMAEYASKQGNSSQARKHYSDASDALREAVGNYNVAAQVFQQMGDAQSAQSMDSRAKTTDLLARGVWDNRQRLNREQEPTYKGEIELAALYLGSTGS